MLDEQSMSINELLNYGYPYYKSINIYNEILNQIFNKKDFEELIRIKNKFYNSLKTNYSFPSSLIDAFINSCDIFKVVYNEKTLQREITFNYKDFIYFIASTYYKYDEEDNLIQTIGTVKQAKNLVIRKLREIGNDIQSYNLLPAITNVIEKNTGHVENKSTNIFEAMIGSINRLYQDIYIHDMYNVNELFEKCDKEKLLFHIMICGINLCNEIEVEDGLVYTIFKYNREKNRDTNVCITYKGYLLDGSKSKIINHEYKDFMYILQKYVLAHPEKEMSEPNFDIEGMTMEEVKNALKEFYEKTKEKYRQVDNIAFLPSKPIGATHSLNGTAHLTGASLIALKKKTLYALNENQIHEKLQGSEKLKGYTVMVLKNGYVILEINDIKNDKIVTKSGAAYIMPLPLFNKLCNCSRTELRQYIVSNPNSKIECIEHREKNNWEERIQSIIDMNTGISIGEERKILEKK